MKNLIIKGNVKMGDEVYLFNLPAEKTCTPTKWCLEGRSGKPRCYALRNNFRLSSAIKASEWRLKESYGNSFSFRMASEIKKVEAKYFRLHSSGDFYNEKYIYKIYNVVKLCPNTLFRCTTRRRDLISFIQVLAQLPNIIVRESLDTERQESKMGLKFACLDCLPIAKKVKFLCNENCKECGYYCWKHNVNIKAKEF